MLSKKKFLVVSMSSFVIFLFLGYALCQNGGKGLLDMFHKDVEQKELIPEHISIEEEFSSPQGIAEVGVIEMVQGTAYIIHEEGNKAFLAKNKLPLYEGDQLVTMEKSRIRAKLIDESAIAVSSYSKLDLAKVKYSKEDKTRENLLRMLKGKARFIVDKLPAGSKENFKVTTPTASIGIRGSDFAVMVVPEYEIEKNTGSKLLSWIYFADVAYAQPQTMVTLLLSGEQTQLAFSGMQGVMQQVGPYSLSYAAAGAPAAVPTALSAAAVNSALQSIGPGLSVMSMPENF